MYFKNLICLGGGTCLPAGRLVDGLHINMRYYVYAISSKIRSYVYVGITNNIQRRLFEHNSGRNTTTKPYAPYELILEEIYKDRPTARLREKFLKSGCGKEWLKSTIKK